MKFVTKADIECPISHVFGQVADFAAFERQALRRGANVRRTDQKPQYGLGASWDVTFKFRGKERQMKAVVTSWDPTNGYTVTSASSGVEAIVKVELVALSRSRTRLALSVELLPKTIGARIMVQSLRLARGTLQRRLDLRLADYASEIVERYRQV